MTTGAKKTVLFCVLNWGLGHATRSTPLIQSYLNKGWKVVLLSDGHALDVLRETFPSSPFVKLPRYGMRYPSKSMAINMLRHGSQVFKAIRSERKMLVNEVKRYRPNLILSDNRYGCFHPEVKSVLITHQLAFPSLSPFTRWLPHWWVRNAVKKFSEVWIPDFAPPSNLTGQLTDGISNTKKKYIGPLSRLEKQSLEQEIEYLVVLSGIEPTRSIFEEKLASILPELKGKKVLVRGLPTESKPLSIDSVTVINYATQSVLSNLMNRAKVVIARAGYSTIMDCVALGKKAILVPTPGQPEQEYLAKQLLKTDWARILSEKRISQELIEEGSFLFANRK